MLNFSEKQQVGLCVKMLDSDSACRHAIFQWRPGSSSTVPVIFCGCIGKQISQQEVLTTVSL
jgi:hypothetical protein